MDDKDVKYFLLSVSLSLIVAMTGLIIHYKNKTFEANKYLFSKNIHQEAKTHFESIKEFSLWNTKLGGVYAKISDDKKDNKFFDDDKLFTEDSQELTKINHAKMARQVTTIMEEDSHYTYKITSLNPLNPKNSPDEFEKKALVYFLENPDEKYYTREDLDNNNFDFVGKLIIEKSCLKCHGAQGFKIGEMKGGIRITIPINQYKDDLEALDSHFNTQVILIICFSVVIFMIIFFAVNRIFSNQEHLKVLKNKYKILYDRYDYAISGSKLGLWDWNIKTDEVYFSKEWKEMLGFEDEELESKLENWSNRVHNADKQKAINDIQANQEKKTEYYENIHRLRHKDGSWVWILDKGRTFFDKDGKPDRMIGFHTNITKIQELKIELSKLKKAIEHSPLSIVITSLDGKIEYVNPYFTKVTGYTFKEILNKNPRILKSNLTTSNEYKTLWETLLSKKTWRGTFKNINKNGNEFWESAIITPIIDNKNEITNFLAIKQEITKEVFLKEELEDKEEMMIAQSRHAAMGEMISMIAHQWRQPISVVSMAANNTLADIELDMIDNEELKENSESIIEQTKYLSQTIEDFRNFFKPNKSEELVTCQSIIEETMKILEKSLENNEIHFKLIVEDNSKVKVYSRELLQVFINIIKNAKEAFENKNISEKIIEVKIYKISNTIRTSFYDNAGEIDEEIKAKIFEPYFSTKNEKTGTGLGLYMSKTIVDKHLNGEIGVYNCDNGVIFYVDLPISKE